MVHLYGKMEVIVDLALPSFFFFQALANENPFAIVDLHITCLLVLLYDSIWQAIDVELIAVTLMDHVLKVLLVLSLQEFLADDLRTICFAYLKSVGALVEILGCKVIVTVMILELSIISTVP